MQTEGSESTIGILKLVSLTCGLPPHPVGSLPHIVVMLHASSLGPGLSPLWIQHVGHCLARRRCLMCDFGEHRTSLSLCLLVCKMGLPWSCLVRLCI